MTVTINGTATATGDVVGNGISLDDHVHGGVQSGGSETTGPIG
jgi:phage baseplate assembly protein gpV